MLSFFPSIDIPISPAVHFKPKPVTSTRPQGFTFTGSPDTFHKMNQPTALAPDDAALASIHFNGAQPRLKPQNKLLFSGRLDSMSEHGKDLQDEVKKKAINAYALRIKNGEKAMLPTSFRMDLIDNNFMTSKATYDEERSALRRFLKEVLYKDSPEDLPTNLKQLGFSTKKKKYSKPKKITEEAGIPASSPAPSTTTTASASVNPKKIWDTGFDWFEEVSEHIPLP